MASSKPPNRRPESTTGFHIPGWVWWTIFAVLLAWNLLTFLAPRGPATITLSYSQFLDQVNAGNVQSVTISGQAVEGRLKKAIPVPGPHRSRRRRPARRPNHPHPIV